MLPRRYINRYAKFIVLSLLLHVIILGVILLEPGTKYGETGKDKHVTVKLDQYNDGDGDGESANQEKEELKGRELKSKQGISPESKKGRTHDIESSKDKKQSSPEEPHSKITSKTKSHLGDTDRAKSRQQESKGSRTRPDKSSIATAAKAKARAEKARAEKARAEKAKAEKAKAEKAKAEKAKAEKAKAEKAKAEKAKAEKAKAEKARAEKARAEKAKAEKAKAEKAKAEKAKATQGKADEDKGKKEGSKKRDDDKRTSNIRSIDPRQRLIDAIPASESSLDKKMVAKNFVQTRESHKLFQQSEFQAKQIQKAMNRKDLTVATDFWTEGYARIEKNLRAPKRSYRDVGKQYSGQIKFLLDKEGYFYNVVFKKRSGSAALDQAFMTALLKTKRLPLPTNRKIKDYVRLKPFLLYYDEGDFAK